MLEATAQLRPGRPRGDPAAVRPEPHAPAQDTYVSRLVFAFEQERFFAGSWTCVGREGDLEGTGAQRAVKVGGAGVLLARGTDERSTGVRQHLPPPGPRAARRGRADLRRTVLCPYHAWTTTWTAPCGPLPGSATTATSARPSTGWSSCRW